MNTCPKCGASGCGTVWREVKRVDGSDGYMNGEGVFIQHRREWTVTEKVIEAESMTCLRRQLAAMSARAEAAESKLAACERERDALKADCARISAELGLPPGIGPADGEIRRIADTASIQQVEIAALKRRLEPLTLQEGGGVNNPIIYGSRPLAWDEITAIVADADRIRSRRQP